MCKLYARTEIFGNFQSVVLFSYQCKPSSTWIYNTSLAFFVFSLLSEYSVFVSELCLHKFSLFQILLVNNISSLNIMNINRKARLLRKACSSGLVNFEADIHT